MTEDTEGCASRCLCGHRHTGRCRNITRGHRCECEGHREASRLAPEEPRRRSGGGRRINMVAAMLAMAALPPGGGR